MGKPMGSVVANPRSAWSQVILKRNLVNHGGLVLHETTGVVTMGMALEVTQAPNLHESKSSYDFGVNSSKLFEYPQN